MPKRVITLKNLIKTEIMNQETEDIKKNFFMSKERDVPLEPPERNRALPTP